jgi:hypothetical protein
MLIAFSILRARSARAACGSRERPRLAARRGPTLLGMTDVSFVLLTLAAFALIAVIGKAVDKL